jgi:ribonucleotide reductase alpha subunit
MSFLKIGDRAAGAIKSGGTTRRAAKMVVVDADHPDIEAYIDWKVKEEQKVAALVTGSKIVQKHLKAIMKACVNCEGRRRLLRPEKNPALKREIKRAPSALVPRTTSSASSSSPAGLHRHRLRDLRHRLGFGGLSHRLRPELQQLGARHRRLPARVETDGDWNLTAAPTARSTRR